MKLDFTQFDQAYEEKASMFKLCTCCPWSSKDDGDELNSCPECDGDLDIEYV